MASVTVAGRASALELLSFRVALAVIAVAVLDDGFAHPEPGTGPGDDLVSGLVPVAVAGALAWAYPRLRPGARATATIVCGVLAVVAGVRALSEHLHTLGVGRVQRWGTNWVVQTAAVAVLSGTQPPPDLAALAARVAPRPVLLIPARDGNPDEALNEVYAGRIGHTATLWTLNRGGHTGALAADPAEYERRVIGFLERVL